jgi:hypothetical protein
MDLFKTGDRVAITLGGQSIAGVVLLASANGRSLMLEFDGVLGGYVGMMPILWVLAAERDGRQELGREIFSGRAQLF